MHQVKISPQCTIKYWTYHDDRRPTIVMIHGFTGSHEGFQYIEPMLGDYRLIIPDLPGFGESTIGRNDWSIQSMARLLNQFIEQLDLVEPPHILGHSMGGLVVPAMVSDKANLYDKVILVAPVPTAIRGNDSRRPGAILGALQYAVGHRVKYLGQKIVKSRTISRAVTNLIMTTTDSELRTKIHSHHFKNLDYISSIEFYNQLHRDINRQGAIDYADALRQKKVLLIAGDRDTVTPLQEQQKLSKTIKPAKLQIIPDVGHLAHYETPDAIASAIAGFLR